MYNNAAKNNNYDNNYRKDKIDIKNALSELNNHYKKGSGAEPPINILLFPCVIIK